ncbi:MFS transporter [Embleya sp. NPDC005575]|uniref:MFS transporter n=1 Tax=Embleya sp. NPDC005575 TaxID=3156892 RepID=UPI0033A03F2E
MDVNTFPSPAPTPDRPSAPGLVFFAAMNGLILVFGLFLQIGLGWSAIHAGLASTPIALGVVLGAVAAGAVLVPRFGRTVLHAGAVVMAAGVAALSLTLHQVGADARHLAPALLFTGVGMGLVLAPFFDIAPASVDEHETGSASGLLDANQQLGATLGVAVLGTLFFDAAAGSHGSRRAGAYTHALEQTLWVVVAALALVLLTAFLLPRRARDEEHGGPAEAPLPGRPAVDPIDSPLAIAAAAAADPNGGHR